MIRRTFKLIAATLMLGSAVSGHAATAPISPALAACSKALVESLATTEQLPTYTVKSPRSFNTHLFDANSFTVLAHSSKSKQLLAKARCEAKPNGEIITFKTLPLKG